MIKYPLPFLLCIFVKTAVNRVIVGLFLFLHVVLVIVFAVKGGHNDILIEITRAFAE